MSSLNEIFNREINSQDDLYNQINDILNIYFPNLKFIILNYSMQMQVYYEAFYIFVCEYNSNIYQLFSLQNDYLMFCEENITFHVLKVLSRKIRYNLLSINEYQWICNLPEHILKEYFLFTDTSIDNYKLLNESKDKFCAWLLIKVLMND